MENISTTETYSTNDSQDHSNSQQESGSEGQYGYDEGNSTSSVHNSPQSEAVSTAIMEVSGELMLGKFTPQKHQAGGSESSDISDDDGRRAISRGSIAKYPESSTGLSDNDWNPYATESDTNQTPRSPRSNNSDDQSHGGYVSKATFNIGSSGTGKIDGSGRNGADKNGRDNLDILRFVMDGDRPREVSSQRMSEDSATTLFRDSAESKPETNDSGTLSGRPSSEYDTGDVYVRDVRDSVDSARSDGIEVKSGRQSVESDRSSKSEASVESGRQSERSQKSAHSQASSQSKQSEKSTVRSVHSDRSDRLDQLSDGVAGSMKHLIEFESAQRYKVADEHNGPDTSRGDDGKRDVACTRLSPRVESYEPLAQSSKSTEQGPVIVKDRGGYVSVVERERLLSDSPELIPILPRSTHDIVQPKPKVTPAQDYVLPDRCSEDSMKRITDLLEETKKQAREAIAISHVGRPEPSGSEERFPLRERLTISKHDDSFKQREKSPFLDARDSEVGRSLNSEEVARVLGRYHDEDLLELRKKDATTFKPVSDYDVDRGRARGEKERRAANSDNESEQISQRVQALLSRAEHLNDRKAALSHNIREETDYVPHTIDYTRLQRDLQEIQDSLIEAPVPVANDSMYLGREERKEQADRSLGNDQQKSLEATRTTYGGRDSGISEFGRESGVSEYGRKLVWDHGADLQYERGYGGQFVGKSASKSGASLSVRTSTDTGTLTGRTSAETIDTEIDHAELSRSMSVSNSDLTRAERIVDQVMSRRAEGDLKESVEDIIARYKNERKDLFHRLQAPKEPSVGTGGKTSESKKPTCILTDPNIALSTLNPSGDASQPKNGKKPVGLAARVYKILRDEDTEDSDAQDEKGMAKKVYKILASDRPEDQVNGILAKAMAEENEALKQMVTKPKEDSSMDDSALNGTRESYDLSEEDVKKQLEYSLYSSPGKGDKSELAALREVTSAPYSALSNAKSLLSSQLQKMSHRTFDKSVELRTPYRQAINCYPIYGVERRAAMERQSELTGPREAWTASGGSTLSSGGRDLGNDRFFLTDRDRQPEPRTRTFSDPFNNSPIKPSREGHTRSEEVGNVSEISQYSFVEAPCSPIADRRHVQSPTSLPGATGELSTPQQHRPKGYTQDTSPSPTESDTSGSKRVNRFRPYRPAGSDMYYTESGDDTNESVTTVESTHPGSDDAAPPYIPSQFLGSRRDDLTRHPTGIYGNKDKDALSTIEEQSAKGELDRASSTMSGSGKTDDDQPARKPNSHLANSENTEVRRTVTTNTDYHSNRSRSPYRSEEVKPRSDTTRAAPVGCREAPVGSREAPAGSSLERPGFKTREEFQQDFERRERELKELLAKPRESDVTERDLGTTTRSDPGDARGVMEDEGGSKWEYRISDHVDGFVSMEPEPAYPQGRLRYSRSKSDTDLVSLSPTDSQRYSSPLQPGTMFLELSTQPSPIGHQDSLTHLARVPLVTPAELPRVPISRELPQTSQHTSVPDDRRFASEPPPQPLEPGERVRSQRSGDTMGPVDLGADPRKIPDHMRGQGRERQTRSKSPLYVRQKEMEEELEILNKKLSDQVNELHGSPPPKEEVFEDNFPPSKKAQVLRQVLEQEYMDSLPPNLNDMWSRFKEQKEQSLTESSLNSTRLDALSGLLQNPTHYTVYSFHREKHEEEQRQKKEEKENLERLKEEQMREKERLKKLSQERSQRRQELCQQHGCSEEESNGSYTELLMEEERKRERLKREAKKEEKRRNRSPTKKSPKSDKDSEKRPSPDFKEKAVVTNIKSRKAAPKQSDSMDTLFSIPEDASFEQSPTKAESEMKSRQKRHRHVIDPLMKKLRDKIKMQRDKIDKERRKELARVEKLKKLEMLLTAKRKGKLSDKAIDVELDNVSSTSCLSHTESSQASDSTITALSSGDSTLESLSTTLRDTTAENVIKLQVKKYPEDDFNGKYIDTTDSTTESSDFSNIIVERVVPVKEGKKTKEKKERKSKSKKGEAGEKVRKSKKENKRRDVFGVELTDKDLANQLQQYEAYMTPERRRRVRDAGTMYPSPITVSPPTRRRMKDVMMKSEAIQTTPSVRSYSPSYAYDEVPVSPVPYMYEKGRSIKPSRRRSPQTQTTSSRSSCTQSISLSRSRTVTPTRQTRTVTPTRQTRTVTPTRKTRTVTPTRQTRTVTPTRQTRTVTPTRQSSRSPAAKHNERSRSQNRASSRSPVRSPVTRPTSGSPGRRRFSPPITRRQAQSPIWKPESEMPPKVSMFTPEDDENIPPKSDKPAESWFISMKPVQPWRQPLKERQAFAIRQEAWKPKSMPQSAWKDAVSNLHDKPDSMDISRDTKFDLDPDGQPIGEGDSDSESEIDIRTRPLAKMSLQEAFQYRKQQTISRLRERQKRLNLAAEQRKMETYLKIERDRLFQEERRKEANPDAHPYSELLYKPARRIISKEEMKEMTQRKYKKLPEVVEQKKLKKRQQDYSLNRVKARLFNRKIQKKVLQRADNWGR